VALYLADSSAWHRSARASERWRSLLEGYGLALCTPVTLELLFSARDRTEYELLARDLDAFPHLPVDAEVEVAAERTQAALATQGQHRGPTPVDLLIAAVAEVHGATLLHYDRHFDAIARVTGQPMEWLARRGRLT
jgi:predicted nucleic acid-binding protein